MILTYGMGVDSTAILLHWLENPASRRFRVYQVEAGITPPTFTYTGDGTFDLSELTVVTAMTGDEFPDLAGLIEKHILPRMRQHGIRYVQIARKSAREKLTVLDDSRAPKKLFLDGAYKLSDDLLGAATVPQYRNNARRCSIKAKGEPLDTWIGQETAGQPFMQAIGFNAEEAVRVTTDLSYSKERWPAGQKTSIYPLMWDWNWNREACIRYIRQVTGVIWPKSACFYCPFASQESVIPRYEKYPDKAAFSLFIEYASRCLNPRQTLYARGSLMSVIQEVGDRDALKLFDKMLDRSAWVIYHVRRIYKTGYSSFTPRSVRIVAEGKRRDMEARLSSYGPIRTDEDGIPRVVLSIKVEGQPSLEELYVAAPKTMQDKEIPSFQRQWEMAARGDWSFLPVREEAEEEYEAEGRESPAISGPRRGNGDGYYDNDDDTERLAWEREMGPLFMLPEDPGPTYIP